MAADKTSVARKRRLDFTGEITVLVGPCETRFMLHKVIATQNSPFLRAAVLGNFKEADEGVVRLPQIEVETFKSFIHWIYTGEVVVVDPDYKAEDDGGVEEYGSLTKLYILGTYLQCIRLCNSVIDQVIELPDKARKFPSINAVDMAFSSTSENSTLQRIIVDFYLSAWGLEWVDWHGKGFHSDFLVAFVRGYRLNGRDGTLHPNLMNRCKYHEHRDEVPLCIPSSS